MLILSSTIGNGKSRGPDNDLYYGVHHISTTCSNAKDNIYLVIVFLELLWDGRFFFSFVVSDTVLKKTNKIASQKNKKLVITAANQHIKFLGSTLFSYQNGSKTLIGRNDNLLQVA